MFGRSLRSLSMLTVLVGCRVPASVAPTAAAPTAAPAPAPVFVEQEQDVEPEPVSVASFESFLGLNYGDTLAQLHARHGQPTYSEPGDELDTLYYVMIGDTIPDDGPPGPGDDFLLIITVNHADGRIFNIQANSGDYAAAGIDDPLLRYLGAPLAEVKASFGEPVDAESGFHRYEYFDDARSREIEVEFVCHEFEDWLCTELWVTWYEP